MENPLIAAETVRKASLSNLRTHEATGSSPVVSTRNHRNHLIPVIFFYNLQLFMALNFCRSFKTHTLTHTGNKLYPRKQMAFLKKVMRLHGKPGE